MKKPLHILYAAKNDSNMHELASDLSLHRFIQVIVVITPQQLKNVLEDYAEYGRMATIWIHVEKHNLSNADEIPRNFRILELLKTQNIINKNAKVYFLTSGSVNNIKGVSNVSEVKANFKDLEVYSQDVFIERNWHELPAPQDINKLIANNYKTIKSFSYPNSSWNRSVIDFRNIVPDEKMSAILGELFHDFPEDASSNVEYLIEIVNPGFSGAFVLHIYRIQNGEQSDFLLKMTRDGNELENEYRQAKYLALKKLHAPTFIGTYPFSKKIVFNWHCLLFEYASGTHTLRAWMRAKLKEEKPSSFQIIRKIRESWNPFERAYENKKSFKTGLNPYLGKGGSQNKCEYKKLQLSLAKQGDVFTTLKKLKKWYNNFGSYSFFEPDDLKHFESFILNGNGNYDGVNITRYSQEGTPVFYGHGDFHGGNILISDKVEGVSYIDFANTRDNLHGFSDWGKLSSDLEISVMPEYEIVDNLPQLQEWIEAHWQWFNNHSLKSNIYSVQKIYSWNSEILNTIKELGVSYGLSEIETIRQFHMVRLHYFLKALSYQYECREKLVFFLRASIDILKFLTQPSKS